jgi:hypothetical protein
LAIRGPKPRSRRTRSDTYVRSSSPCAWLRHYPRAGVRRHESKAASNARSARRVREDGAVGRHKDATVRCNGR